MKNILTKIGYMAFGGLLTLIGYHFGNIDNNSADAQVFTIEDPKPEIVDEIRCRKLVIVGNDNTSRIILSAYSALTNYYGLDQGGIEIFDKDGASRIFLGVDTMDRGGLLVKGKESGEAAIVYGGSIALFNNTARKAVLQAGIANTAEGFIFTTDKDGETTDVVGPNGGFDYDAVTDMLITPR